MVVDNCTFCQIVAGTIQAQQILQDETCLAFLDKRPLFPGHCLLIPKEHYETLDQLPRTLIEPLFVNAQRLVRAVEAAMKAEGTFLAINNRVSQSVPHLHVHIVPRRKHDGLRGFFWPRRKYESNQAIEQVAEAVRAALT